jgi:hypothetical protein
MLTVTGLWASLQIGDKTNLFTRVPEWVGTNGVTNAATYGDYPWQIYAEDLQERYKVLNALRYTSAAVSTKGRTRTGVATPTANDWAVVKMSAEEDFLSHKSYDIDNYFMFLTFAYYDTNSLQRSAGIYSCSITNMSLTSISLSTSVNHRISFFAELADYRNEFIDFNGLIDLDATTNYFQIIAEQGSFNNESSAEIDDVITPTEDQIPNWCSDPALSSVMVGTERYSERGFWFVAVPYYKKIRGVVDWQFNYCTNKYW